MTHEEKIQWQRHVARAIVSPAEVTAKEKLTLLSAWPILRAWAQSVLKRDPDKVPAKTLDAYLRDALAWSGHQGSPADMLAHYVVQPAAKPQQQQQKSATTAPSVKGESDSPTHPSPTPQSEQTRHPNHFDEYRHLCPIELQQRYDEEIADLYLLRAELAARRDQLADAEEQAMYAGDEKGEDEAAAQLSQVAQQLVSVDATLRAFWALVDVAFRYYQLNGEVMTIEDLREQAPVSVESTTVRKRAPRTPDHTKAEIEDMPEGEEREAAKAERIRKNAQFLRDKRKADNARANGGEAYSKWREQILLRAKEQEEWGEALTQVQQEIVASASA